MDGIYFYWFSWIGWIISTFFMKKDQTRFLISTAILLLIIMSSIVVQIENYKLNISIVFLLISSYSLVRTKTKLQKIYLLICVITVMLAFVSFHLFELFDPVWLLFNRKWMLAFALSYIILMLLQDMKTRIVALIIGASQGEFLYVFILSKFNIRYEIGSFQFLDVLSGGIFLIFVWFIFENMAYYFDVLLQKNGKEKAS